LKTEKSSITKVRKQFLAGKWIHCLRRLHNSSKTLKYSPKIVFEPVEEYEPAGFHPVQIGNTFESGHYLIVHRLAFGGFSTVWLALDSCRKNYVALKFIAAKHYYSMVLSKLFRALALGGAAGRNEIKIIDYTAQGVDAEGRKRLVVDVEGFWIRGPNGKHLVLVFEVNGPCL
jgi:serine/threonine-protein kinase SRPK3